MDEQDPRLALLNTLLTTPHRDLAALSPLHREIAEKDPRFYSRLAAWYADHGDVRDHKEMFVITLCLSRFEGHRDVGLALLRRLPPYEVARVVDFVKGQEVRRRVPAAGTGQRQPVAARSKAARRRAARAGVRQVAQTEPRVERVGLFTNVPRSMRTEIERYLREREARPERLDAAILHGRAALKRLYAGLHIRPSERAQAILFTNNPPEDSVFYALLDIATSADPADQARAIVRHRIPYRVASSVIRQMTPTVLAALIDVMTPQEVINTVGSLKRRGALDNPDIKALVDRKLEEARGDKRVSAYKAKIAIKASDASGELAEKLDEITEAQVKARGTISRPTALLIDTSGSMEQAIEVGRQLGAMISAICASSLFAYAFDTVAYPIEAQGTSLADWERALAGITAGGSTSCGVAIEWMRRKGQRVEQLILVSDEQENSAPVFAEAYKAYAEQFQVRPDVVLVKVGHAGTKLEQECTRLGLAPRVFEFKGDYYALTNLVPLLTRPSMLELLMEILEYPLPQRRAP